MNSLAPITAALAQPAAAAIVRALMGYSGRTRSELSAELRQRQEAIDAALESLIELGIVRSEANGCALDTVQYAVIALDVGGTKVLGALMNLHGDELDVFELRWADFPSAGDNDIAPLCHMIDRFIEAAQGRMLLGVALGLPGVTDVDSGIVKWAPGPAWRDLPLRNLLSDPGVGLLFLIPGRGETLRVNGRARIAITPELLTRFAVDGKPPRSVLVIDVESVYFQCARAIVRAALWQADAHPAVALPSIGTILSDLSNATIDGSAYDRALPERIRNTLY